MLRFYTRYQYVLEKDSHPCFGGGSTETSDVLERRTYRLPRTPASAGVPLRPVLGSNNFNVFSTRTPASAGVPLRRGKRRIQVHVHSPRTPASAGVPLRLCRAYHVSYTIHSHPCFGGGSTETRFFIEPVSNITTRTPASAGVPLRLFYYRAVDLMLNSHPCFGGGSTETVMFLKTQTETVFSHPCFGGGSTET